MIRAIAGYDADHPLAYSAPDSGCGILHRASGVRRLSVSLDDGETVDVSGADFEAWVRLYAKVGKHATATWSEHQLGEGTAPNPD